MTLKSALSIVWAIAFVGEFLVPYTLSLFIRDYSHMKTVMSAIGANKSLVGKVYSGWLVVFGGLCVVYSVMFVKINMSSINNSIRVGAAFIALYGIGSGIICGLFRVDETREMVSISAKIHGGAVVLAFFLLMFLPLVLRNYTVGIVGIQGTWISILTFIICLLWFVLQILSEKETFMNTCLGYTGLWQRLYLFSIYTYIAIITVWTIKSK